MFVRLAFDREQWEELVAYCQSLGFPFLTTVQDSIDLKLMLDLGGLAAVKKGSDDFDFLSNLSEAARTGLPLILSKGMATLGEVDRIVRAVLDETDKLIVLHCVSLYPAEPNLLNINQIPMLKSLYPDVIWGFSDHSEGTLASTIAVARGAKVIEKHFTLDHSMAGPDHWFSMAPEQMAQMVKDIRYVEEALGSGEILPSARETESRAIMRRRVVARSELPAGTILDATTVCFKRASSGAFLDQWDLIDGARLRNSKKKDEGISLIDVEW
jgi:sialic acid synthase SpsE